jgi:hypothetical protein
MCFFDVVSTAREISYSEHAVLVQPLQPRRSRDVLSVSKPREPREEIGVVF